MTEWCPSSSAVVLVTTSTIDSGLRRNLDAPLVKRANVAEELTSLGSGFRRNDPRDAILVVCFIKTKSWTRLPWVPPGTGLRRGGRSPLRVGLSGQREGSGDGRLPMAPGGLVGRQQLQGQVGLQAAFLDGQVCFQ